MGKDEGVHINPDGLARQAAWESVTQHGLIGGDLGVFWGAMRSDIGPHVPRLFIPPAHARTVARASDRQIRGASGGLRSRVACMDDEQQAGPTSGPISRDGRHQWNGSEWVPIPPPPIKKMGAHDYFQLFAYTVIALVVIGVLASLLLPDSSR